MGIFRSLHKESGGLFLQDQQNDIIGLHGRRKCGCIELGECLMIDLSSSIVTSCSMRAEFVLGRYPIVCER